MKMPSTIEGIFRNGQLEKVVRGAGVIPQSVCEDVCFENHAMGSSQHQVCLERCRD